MVIFLSTSHSDDPIVNLIGLGMFAVAIIAGLLSRYNQKRKDERKKEEKV